MHVQYCKGVRWKKGKVFVYFSNKNPPILYTTTKGFSVLRDFTYYEQWAAMLNRDVNLQLRSCRPPG